MIEKTGDWTTRELAEEAARRGQPVTQTYIRQLCERGAMRARKPGRDWLIPDYVAKAWLDAWLKGEQ